LSRQHVEVGGRVMGFLSNVVPVEVAAPGSESGESDEFDDEFLDHY
jgi:hypothetical protein